MNLTDVTPDTLTTRCAVCQLLDEATPSDAAILQGWIAAITEGTLRRSAVRSAIHRGSGPLISETAFGRHIRNHT